MKELIGLFKSVIDIFQAREKYLNEHGNDDTAEEMYWEVIDLYGNAMTELEKYNTQYYEFCDDILIKGYTADIISKNAIYCITQNKIPKKILFIA